MKNIYKYLILFAFTVSSLAHAAGTADSRALKDLTKMASSYEVDRKSPALFFKKYVKDKKKAEDWQKLSQKYNVKALPPATFKDNTITFVLNKKKVILELTNVEQLKVKINGYEHTLNKNMTAEQEFKYIGRVLRKTGYAWWRQWILPEAHASDDEKVFSVAVGGAWGWLVGYPIHDKILQERDKLSKEASENLKVHISCEPQHLVFVNDSVKHEVRISSNARNFARADEYSQMANAAVRMGLLTDRTDISAEVKSQNMILTSEVYSGKVSARVDNGKFRFMPGETVASETSFPEHNRLKDERYRNLVTLLHDCCAENSQDCSEVVNSSRAGMPTAPSEPASRGSR